MPNVKSAEKRMRTSKIREQRNKAYRSRLRTAVKKVHQTENPDAAGEAFQKATALIDRAAAKRIIHPNKAARMKSQLDGVVRKKATAEG